MEIEEVPETEMQAIFASLSPNPRRVVLIDIYPELKKQGIYCSIISLLPDLGYRQDNQYIIFSKLIRIDEKIKLAFENEFYLEWISLLLIKAEFWLRVFLFNANSYSDKHVLKDSLTFGMIIHECRKAKIDTVLRKKLQAINYSRIQYIHNYLKDGFEYDSIKIKRDEFERTIDELNKYCIKNSVRILDNAADIADTVGFVKFVRFK